MAFSVVGIQAHFTKTLLLFFLPQIFNFILSCPQLFGLVPCPRHRVPRCTTSVFELLRRYANFVQLRFDPDTNLLHPSKTHFPKPPKQLTAVILRLLSFLGLTSITTHPTTGQILEANNLTILNFLLLRFGPMSEKQLVRVLMCVQVSSHG